MLKLPLSVCLICAGVLSGAAPAPAQTTSPPLAVSAPGGRGSDWATRLMLRIDRDRRGYFTELEALRYAARRFDRMDVNKNGVLTREEFLGTLPRRLDRADSRSKARLERAVAAREATFDALDHEKHGTITRAAYLAIAKKRFADLDRQGIGRVTVDDLRKVGHGV